jgi:hypothetical protein
MFGRAVFVVAVGAVRALMVVVVAGADIVGPCAGYPLKWTRRKALAEVAHERARCGLPHDEADLARRARHVRRHGRTTWEVPLSGAERAYVRARDRLWRLIDAVDDFARSQAAADYGGAGIGDDWPRAPFVEVRFTRDVAEYVAAVRSRTGAGDVVRGRRVARSEIELERLRDRVEADIARLRSEQLQLRSVDIDQDANVVRVDLCSPRPDASHALLSRYGDGVQARVSGPPEFEEACHDVNAYRISASGRVLHIQWGGSGLLRLARVEVHENERRVLVGVVVERPVGFLTADLRMHEERVHLQHPLDHRSVVDAATGKRLSPRHWWEYPRNLRG